MSPHVSLEATTSRRTFALPPLAVGALIALSLGLAPVARAEGSKDTDQGTAPVPGAPSIRDVIDLPSVSSPRISPDGTMIAWVQRTTDWDKNRYDNEIWLAKPGTEPFQLTRNAENSSSNPRWSPDGMWLAFVTDRGEDSQVYRISPRGGEAVPITDRKGGVQDFRWSPDGKAIAFRARDANELLERRAKRYGAFSVEDQNLTYPHLWVQDVLEPGAAEIPEARQLTDGTDFAVGGFAWSPNGATIAFDHRPKPQVDSFVDADISLVDVVGGEVRPLVRRPGPDSGPVFSPDGGWIAFSSPFGNNSYYGNDLIGRVPIAGGEPQALTAHFDEDARPLWWNEHGIWFAANERTERRLFLLDPDAGSIGTVLDRPVILGAGNASADGLALAISGEGPDTLDEVYRVELAGNLAVRETTRLTDQTSLVDGWPLGGREVITWESRDGEQIEGVLLKPPGHDPSQPAPLLVAIHGGPTGTSRPALLNAYVYPVVQWLAKGALILMPNYRGSAGYGARFRALNVRNLGVGDAWDVMSGVDALVERGLADPDKLGAMGWSQGGYISAFLATNTDRFKAISNGAGISNWITYYVNTDIHGFTRQYLEATPWDDPAVYAKTSPITNIKQAKTPTLIQHGENDARVPIPNAYELYQGLQDVGVPTELVVYEDFGHGITKPKERLAATWHNWIWFARWVWGEEVELPLPEDGEDDEDSE